MSTVSQKNEVNDESSSSELYAKMDQDMDVYRDGNAIGLQ